MLNKHMLLQNTFRNPPKHFRINTELFRFSLLHSLTIPMTPKTYLVAPSTLKCVTLRFGKYYRHGRDSSPANDHQRDLDAHNGPCALHE